MIKIGTSGFSFKDWKGTVYPENLKEKDYLSYYYKELGMEAVEINLSYYTFISTKAAKSWVDKTGKNFLFAIKCHRGMTLNELGNINSIEVNNSGIFERFLDSWKIMMGSGKLLTFLAQFGPAFVKNRNNLDYLKRFRENFKELPLTIEFRHKSWLDEDQKESTFSFLRENQLGYAVVDEPKLRSLAPLVPAATSDIGYVRLHGRNRRWFESGSGNRYDYFYSDEELQEFIPFIEDLMKRTALTAVFFNNCHAGAALKNAIKLRHMLGIARENLYRKEKEQMNLPIEE